jgi:hypothetical protein
MTAGHKGRAHRLVGGYPMKLSKGKNGKAPRSVTFAIIFRKRPDGVIHIATNDPEGVGFNVGISNDPTKRNGHPTLYRKLDAFLTMKGIQDTTAR